MRSAGVELGGTKCIVALADGDNIVQSETIPTTTPDETLSRAAAVLARWDAEQPLETLGIASFGPIRVDPSAGDYGTILATPKPGWRGVKVLEALGKRVDCPAALDTDVNGAALAEYRYGAARGCDSVVYLNIGTGIGGGVLVDGKPVHGIMHPEIGHARVRRVPGDGFEGVCSFHGDCAEGLVSGPALEARFGKHPSLATVDDPRWENPASDLSELLALLILFFSPARIVVGGGVALKQPRLLARAVELLAPRLSGYLVDFDEQRLADLVVRPDMGGMAGPMGAVLIGRRALAKVKEDPFPTAMLLRRYAEWGRVRDRAE